MVNLLYGTMFRPSLGGDYERVKGTDNKILGLPSQDKRGIMTVLKEIIEESNLKRNKSYKVNRRVRKSYTSTFNYKENFRSFKLYQFYITNTPSIKDYTY